MTRYGYDVMNRLVKTCWGDGLEVVPDTDPDDTEPGCTSQFFDVAGRLTNTVNETGERVTFEHDGMGRVIRTLGPLPDPVHDLLISGRPVTETRHDALGRVAWTRDPEGRFVVLEHDDAGQETRRCLAQDEDDDGELDPEEDLVECVTTEHDEIGRRTATENALGHRTTHSYNDAGQLASVTDALEHSTSYEYTGLGELESWTDAMGRTTRLEYDHAGHRTARVLPMLQREEWRHGPDGKVETHRDFMGRLTVKHHDAFGRLERVEHPD